MVVKRNKKKISIKASDVANRRTKYIRAAEDDFDDFDDVDDGDTLLDALDDVADNVEDLQDAVDDMAEDKVEIAVNNNIADHFIAECDACNGIFISAVVDSDQQIDHVSGICPLCGKETDQLLKWIIRDANEDESEPVI